MCSVKQPCFQRKGFVVGLQFNQIIDSHMLLSECNIGPLIDLPNLIGGAT